MSLSVESIVEDAKKLALRLREHGSSADCLLARTQSLQKQLEIMKQVSAVLYIFAALWQKWYKTSQLVAGFVILSMDYHASIVFHHPSRFCYYCYDSKQNLYHVVISLT